MQRDVVDDKIMFLCSVYAVARVEPIPMFFLDLLKDLKKSIQLRYKMIIVWFHLTVTNTLMINGQKAGQQASVKNIGL
jgi:hypothetical protein